MNDRYRVLLDACSGQEWDSILEDFDDSSIYQTWGYGESVSDGRIPSTFALERNGRIVAACLLRIVKERVLNSGFAYARWGPLWKRDGIDMQERRRNVHAMVRALAEEYSGKRNLILKVLPHIHEDDESKAEVAQALKEHGFVKDRTFEDRTILIDLSRDLDTLRANLHQGWRRNLKKAEKNHIEVTEGTQGEHLAAFRNLYGKMLRRKNYIPSVDLEQYIEMQKTLKRKMLTFIAHHGASPCSGAIVSFLGNTAIYLFGATDDRAVTLNASYLVHWKIMERLKEMGASWYDLNGANPERNPDMYRFKDGLGGKERREVSFIGRFDKYRRTIANRLLVKAFEMSKRLQATPGATSADSPAGENG